MLHSFSFGELILIFGIIIVLFGGSRLASVGKALGEGIANFKKGLSTTVDDKPKLDSQTTSVQAHEPVQLPNNASASHVRVVEVESKEPHCVK